ncbi:uncharacterized protein [Dysidea avara]|uniref:uncharacterized protein isoform X2 n=1 Tax=Dysidea avara TaxID=196820 RepID=UPI003324A6F5
MGRNIKLHCLHRWVVCGLLLVEDGTDRWRRYYVKRRRLDNHMEEGHPVRDYTAESLREHDGFITDFIYIKSIDINYDGMMPQTLASYDRDGGIIGWDVNKGFHLWKGKTSPKHAAIANSPDGTLLLYPSQTSDSICFTSTQDWRLSEKHGIKLPAMSVPPNTTVYVTSLMYARISNRNLPKLYLLVGRGANTEYSRVEIWNPEEQNPAGPLAMLDTTGLMPTKLQLSTNGVLAVSGDRNYVDSFSPDVKIWDLTVLKVDGSLIKEDILIRSRKDVMNIQWWVGLCGVLAIGATGEEGITVWELQPYIDQIKAKQRAKKPPHTAAATPFGTKQTISLPYTSASQAVKNFNTYETFCPMASTRHYLLFAGGGDNRLHLLAPGESVPLAVVVEHRLPITGVVATDFGVFTCSRDYSVRVYKWNETKLGEAPSLESLYSLLGGSQMYHSHPDGYGFCAIGHNYNSVAAVCGSKIKAYIFNK